MERENLKGNHGLIRIFPSFVISLTRISVFETNTAVILDCNFLPSERKLHSFLVPESQEIEG